MRITKYINRFICMCQLNGKWVWSVEAWLTDRVESLKEQWKRGCEEEDMYRIHCCWDDLMNVNEELMEDISKESDADDENDSEEVKALKVCLFSVVLLRAVTESICPRNDIITSAVSYNLPMINSMPLCNPPNIHSTPRKSCPSQ
jgi:hypothetical protein